mmetsp:Transcript_52632/g.163428  ORF Transcript_52632/g.163428 Transcript_52632/m.163428 type:complete len:160 (-) Transcript_52632:53-532(-)
MARRSRPGGAPPASKSWGSGMESAFPTKSAHLPLLLFDPPARGSRENSRGVCPVHDRVAFDESGQDAAASQAMDVADSPGSTPQWQGFEQILAEDEADGWCGWSMHGATVVGDLVHAPTASSGLSGAARYPPIPAGTMPGASLDIAGNGPGRQSRRSTP